MREPGAQSLPPVDVPLQFMEYAIRRAVIEDAEAIAVVQVESWRSTYVGIVPDAVIASLTVEFRTERWKEEFAGGSSILFVAENRSGIFGFVSGGKLRQASDGNSIEGYDGELYAIYLLAKNQRYGAGRLLLYRLAEALHGAGFNSMVVWVLKQNPAVSFYRRMGGIEITESTIELGGIQLAELAFGWPTLGFALNGGIDSIEPES
jgi:ribosomal protein S18 acetylase RimI-like enzyme